MNKPVMPIGEPIIVGNKVSPPWAKYFQELADYKGQPITVEVKKPQRKKSD